MTQNSPVAHEQSLIAAHAGSLPPEPGLEVTAVRDRLGIIWTRATPIWWRPAPGQRDPDCAETTLDWHSLLSRGPIVAVDEVAS